MNRKGKILALALTLALSVTSTLMVGCYEGQTGSTEKTSSITLDKENLSLDAGRSEQLSASSAEVKWETSDPGVATVDENGNVTGVNEGTCKITASTKDGKFESECVVVVSGYRLSKNVVSGINKIENNTYNGEINYVVNGSDDNAFVVSYDRSKMTNTWTSLVLWYDAAMDATSFELDFEVTKGSLPVMQFEFGGESSFKQYQRYAVKSGKNSVSLNTTDVDLDGEGSWKAIYLELNNPCPLEGTTDETKGETEIKFTKIAMVAGEKQAPEAPGYVEVKEGVVYWERVFAASEYELEVDGNAITDLTQRTRPSGDAPMMCRAYKPTDEKAFEVGTHIAKIRSKNSAGVSEWNEFTFTVAPTSQEEAETFRGIKGQGNNQYNATPDFYTATINEDKTVKIGFTAAASDEWSSYLFNFDTATIAATKLRIKVRLVSGNLKQVRFQIDRWDSETSSSKTVYGNDLEFDDKGEAELTMDVESEKLAASNGSVMLFLNKYATAGEKIEIEITDVSLF